MTPRVYLAMMTATSDKPEPDGQRPEAFVDAATLAAHVGCSRQWISHLASRGVLRSYKVGRVRRFRISDLEEFMLAHSTGGS